MSRLWRTAQDCLVGGLCGVVTCDDMWLLDSQLGRMEKLRIAQGNKFLFLVIFILELLFVHGH